MEVPPIQDDGIDGNNYVNEKEDAVENDIIRVSSFTNSGNTRTIT